jgi:peptidylprolyl isomerase
MKGTILLIILALFLVSCGGTEKLEISGSPANAGGETMKTAVFETNIGHFTVELFVDEMPITTKNFIDLAEKGFYDSTKFHRVIPGFMVQGGDPLSKDDSKQAQWGTGGPGYKIKDEFTDNNKNNKGTISMANAGPNTGGSQFFINVANNNFLDGKHPVFGKVTEGMQIVNKIVNVETASQDRPVEDVVIEKITIK